MMESLKDKVVPQLRALRPSFLAKKPHFNFISVHYFYIIGLSILGSVLIFGPGRGNIAYIDALAFSAGAATQAGLNTVNVNDLTTYQQAVIFCIAGIANPITINSFVVLLRLYWFEKRFQHIVRESRLRRGTISKSKSKTMADLSRLENGARRPNITVMHNGARSRLANDGTYLGPMAAVATDGPPPANGAASKAAAATASASANGDLAGPPTFTLTEPLESRRPEIKFAPTVKRSDGLDDDATKLPPRLTDAEHIAILERQRNPSDDEVLRIPGPRDAERGVLPSRVARGESDEDDEPAAGARARPGSFAVRGRNGSEASTTWSQSGRHRPSMPLSERAGGPAVADADAPTQGRDDGAGGQTDGAGGQTDGAGGPGEDLLSRPRLAQAITIQEPEKPEKPSRGDELSEDAHAFAHVFKSLHGGHRHRRGSRNSRTSGGDNGGDDGDDGDRGSRLRPTMSPSSRRRQTLQSLRTVFTREKDADPAPYLSWEPTLGRNSAFLDLSEEQREELGGIEYRSLKTLALVLLGYFAGFWLLGVVCLLPWIVRSATYGRAVDAASQSRVWWGFFTPHSAFMDLGFTLTPDSMNSFSTAVFPLLLMSFLIVIGNTGFPVVLRFVIWVLCSLVPRGSGVYEELKFLLDHPRRCFTLLFPAGATWLLFWLLVALNGIDLLFFCVLDLGSGPINHLPAGIRVLDGLFQAFSTRTAGFSCVNLADVHPAVQASYMIMMYISVFPIAISVRRTNVYEEKSLGVYQYNDVDEPTNGTDFEYVGAHLRRQLSFDLWFLSVGFFILMISEGGRIQAGAFSMFAVLFEVVSAYGTVGMSLGFSGGDASLCSQFSVVGKLVIIAMMIRGRHRGLPYGLDRAILLPSESLNAKEAAAADSELARNYMSTAAAHRRESAASVPTLHHAPGPGFPRSSSTRDRRRSRSMERVNSNILAQFMHPGPPVMHSSALLPSVPTRRSFTEPVFEEDSTAQASGADVSEARWRQPR